MFSLRESRWKGVTLEFGSLCELQDKPDSAQWTPVADKSGLDTLVIEPKGLG